MNLIVAVDNRYGIGRDGGLLTYLPDDLKMFKGKTLGKVIIMGRKTVDSLPGGRLLPKRETWILTRNPEYEKEGARIFHSIGEILAYISDNGIDTEDVFVAGGAALYNDFLPLVDRAFITRIDEDFHADVHMTNVDELPYMYLAHVGERQNNNGHEFRFTEYRRSRSYPHLCT